MGALGAAAPEGATCGHEHLVEFYETDAFLVDTVAGFIGPALRERDAAIVVATAEHRDAFAAAIRAEGIDLAAAVEDGCYVALDAVELLSTFMVDGAPDPVRFRDAVGSVMDRAGANGRKVKVYGEMVAQLWADGDVASTIALEDLWNDLAAVRSFSLLCAYPAGAFDDDACAAFKQICAQHTTVIPTQSQSLLSAADEQQRTIAELQLQTAALRVALDRLRQEHENLAELAYVDPLTGLANRRAFDMHLQREWGLALRDGIDSFVVVADIDGLKELNDTRGHAVGDDALCQFAKALQLAARSTDIQARIGGDEFGVLLVRCDERAAHSFSVRLRDAMAEQIGPRLGPLSVSLAHASLLQSTSAGKALEHADLAMLAKKRSIYRERSCSCSYSLGQAASGSAVRRSSRSQGRESLSAERIARVAGERLSV